MKFHELKVSTIQRLTPASIHVEFEIPKALKENYKFKAGQYLTILLGDDARRDYSISCSPNSGILSIGIKQVSNGQWSKYLNNELKTGDVLKVSEPQGRFGIPTKPNEKRTIQAYVAGSGITPIISILEYTLETESGVEFYLFYANQTPESSMYYKRLKAINEKYPKNLFVYNFYTQVPNDNWLFEGRLDAKKFTLINNQLVDLDETDEVLICGPEDMIRQIANESFQSGIPKECIHFELFTTPSESIFEELNKETSDVENVKVTVELDGDEHEFIWENNGMTLLEALLDEGLDAPYSCKGGVCSSCMCELKEGDVITGENVVLTNDDIEEGMRLTCVSQPKTPILSISFEDI